MKRGLFHLKEHKTSAKQEIIAGLTGFFTIVYIIAVNALILSEAGMPLEGAMLATILTSFFGCLIMGLWANALSLLYLEWELMPCFHIHLFIPWD